MNDNDLCHVSEILDLIFFADDTNIFYSHRTRIHLHRL